MISINSEDHIMLYIYLPLIVVFFHIYTTVENNEAHTHTHTILLVVNSSSVQVYLIVLFYQIVVLLPLAVDSVP